MDEEEDWDAEPKNSPVKATALEPSTPATYETLKITDGFKYSYEALASPANIDDWIDPPSYGSGSRRPNGFRDNNFKDSGRPFNNKRFDGPKRNNSQNGPRNFDGAKPSRFSNRPREDWDAPAEDIFSSAPSRPAPVEDWDAPPVDAANSMNGWKTPHMGTPHMGTPHIGTPHMGTPHIGTPHMGTPHIGTPHMGTPHMGTPHMGTPHAHMGTPIASAAVDDDEDWDAPAPGSVHSTPRPAVTPLPMFNPSTTASPAMFNPKPVHSGTPHDQSWDDPVDRTPSYKQSHQKPAQPSRASAAADDDENWDDDPPRAPSAVDIPIFNPNMSSNMSVKSMELSSPRPSSVMNTPAPNDDEDWDEPGIGKKSETPIPMFNPSSATASPMSMGFGFGSDSPGFVDEPREQGFGGRSHSRNSNRGFGEERGFGGGGGDERGFGGGGGDERGFGRDNYRGNRGGFDRYSNFDRRGGGRGGGRDDRGGRGRRGGRDDRRGGRGGRGGGRDRDRDGYNSRDGSRSRDRSFNRRDSYGGGGGGKPFGRQDDDSFRSPKPSYNTPLQHEENWDDEPNTSSSAPNTNTSLPVLPIGASEPPSKAVVDEESWD